MNCLEYRRRRSAEPVSRDARLLAHEHGCPACSAFAQRQRVLEAPLESALQIEVPEGLTSRILLAQSLAQRDRRRTWQRPVYALAASVLLVLGITARLWLAGPSLEQAVLAHVHDEAQYLSEQRVVPVAEINLVMGDFDRQVRAGFGTVHYAGRCTIRRHPGAHLVVEGGKGPVTILYMEGEKIAGRVMFEDARFAGILVPAGDASFAIVGERGEQLEAVERRFRAAVTS
jgi:hypothetical protein